MTTTQVSSASPPGLLLIALGVVTLWRSRRLDERHVRRYPRRALVGIAGALVFGMPVLPVVMSYGYTHIGRAVVPEANLGAAHQEVTLDTSDGLQLEGWYVPSKNRAAVIAFPGRKGTQRQTRMLVRHGYGVLLFDRRGEGDSEGDPNAFGWDGENDLRAALAFLRGRPDVDPNRIGGIGRSVGGELMLQTAAHTDELKAVVSEGAGIRSVREVLEDDGIGKWLALPFFSATTAGVAVFGNKGPPENLSDLVAKISPRAVYLIHAKRGQGGEDLSGSTFYESAGEPKFVWETDSGHVGGAEAQPAEYERRVVGFFDRFLLDGAKQRQGRSETAAWRRHSWSRASSSHKARGLNSEGPPTRAALLQVRFERKAVWYSPVGHPPAPLLAGARGGLRQAAHTLLAPRRRSRDGGNGRPPSGPAPPASR